MCESFLIHWVSHWISKKMYHLTWLENIYFKRIHCAYDINDMSYFCYLFQSIPWSCFCICCSGFFVSYNLSVLLFSRFFKSSYFRGLTYGSGFLVTFNDIGGKFAGIVFSLSNTIGMLSGVFSPYVVAILTTHVIYLFRLKFVSTSRFLTLYNLNRKPKRSGGTFLS